MTVYLRYGWTGRYDDCEAPNYTQDEYEEARLLYESIINKVVNIHLRGSLRECRWVLNSSNFGFYEALDLIRDRWEYSGLLTVEPEGKKDKSLFNSFVKAMQSLRT